MSPVICMVAPNGARRTKSDHPDLPMTADELAQTAGQVIKAGATAMHVHVRDTEGRHSLSVNNYQKAIDAIRQVCGDSLLLQVTTEAAGIYNVQAQIELVYKLQPQAVSLSVRELARASQKDISALDQWMCAHEVLPQWILYSEDDLQQYKRWIDESVLCGTAYPALFVLGNYTKKIVANVDMLTPFLASTELFSSWMVCAFGYTESEIMKAVVAAGGHMRVGFENNLCRPDQKTVSNNAELVEANVRSVCEQGLEIATVAQTLRLLTPAW